MKYTIHKNRYYLLSIFLGLCALTACAETSSWLDNTKSLWTQADQLALNTPTTFGRTHFIVGYQKDEEQPEQASHKANNSPLPFVLADDGTLKTVFFSPDDNVRFALLHLIKQEEESIKIAIFSFTEPKIAQALLEAHKRGVHIELVADAACLRDRYNKVVVLCDHGLEIFVYNTAYCKQAMSSCMHHKFAVFGKNIFNKSIIWTGSFNFTKAASHHNQENVIVLDDRLVIEKFTAQFKQLKARSHRYGRSSYNYKSSTGK